MPMIVTMNGDHQAAASAPLDLSTCKRGSAAGSAPASSCNSPPPPASSGTNHAHGRLSADSRKRPSSLLLPLRKRPIRVGANLPSEGGDRSSPAEAADLLRHGARRPGRLEPEAGDSGVVRGGSLTCYQSQTTPQHPNVYQAGFLSYGHQLLYCPPPERNHSFLCHTDYRSGLAIATRKDDDGDTALHIAVVQGKMPIVSMLLQLLISANKDLDIYNNLRQTPLHLAVITQQPAMVEILLRAGADPAAVDRNGQTALHLSCEYEQLDCLSLLLTKKNLSSCLEKKNCDGLTPLHLAVLHGRKDMASELLKVGADINAMDDKSGQNPLMHAVQCDNIDMIYFLIEERCNVNCQSYSGNTALHSASGRGQVETVQLLLKNGADSSLKNYHNDTPVMVAKNKATTDVLRGRLVKTEQRSRSTVSDNQPYRQWNSISSTPYTIENTSQF
ncbi:B-cell lymphoma 3 protein [Synchiropus splendidus]|uniref:B-cell lymphoma 3 protein n=1 Tax=Synchiropus splendidus TaxID=270530 RepID=UPI00237D6F8B|nr:B-cell lymphoma 3 protein [Synchiropus splendidus]